MEVTDRLIAEIPAGNLRVRRSDFARVWREAERLTAEFGRRQVDDWFPAGVALTCRWLAGAVVQDQTGRRAPAAAPVTRVRARAYEELIEAELLAAELLPQRDPETVRRRMGWSSAITATLRWAWLHDGPPPLVVGESNVPSAAIARLTPPER